jgi:hypothetical protein
MALVFTEFEHVIGKLVMYNFGLSNIVNTSVITTNFAMVFGVSRWCGPFWPIPAPSAEISWSSV